MSMNLHIEVDKKALEVYQTPTFVTEMCMVSNNGKIEFEKKGIKAIHAIHIYLQWVNSLSNGTYSSSELATEARNRVVYHINYIKKSIEGIDPKKITVWSM